MFAPQLWIWSMAESVASAEMSVIFLQEYHVEDFGEGNMKEQNFKKHRHKMGCKSLCMQLQMEDQCLDAHVAPMGLSLKC